jgi:hypothetical protein
VRLAVTVVVFDVVILVVVEVGVEVVQDVRTSDAPIIQVSAIHIIPFFKICLLENFHRLSMCSSIRHPLINVDEILYGIHY